MAIVFLPGVENSITRAGIAIMMIMSTGISRVVMTKLFFTTRSRNSRAIMTLIFDFTILSYWRVVSVFQDGCRVESRPRLWERRRWLSPPS